MGKSLRTLLSNFKFRIYKDFFIKPKLLLGLLLNPNKIFKDTYFPELERKNKFSIFMDHLKMILFYATIDEYYYMYGLDVKRKETIHDYVMYSDFMRIRNILNLKNPHNDSSVLRNKLNFEAVAASIGVPTPVNIAYIKDGDITLLHNSFAKKVKWSSLIASLKGGVFFIKPIDGECGSGIYKLSFKDGTILLNGNKTNVLELSQIFSRGKFIVQSALTQHPEMNRLYPFSVNTIRLITVKNFANDKIQALPATLRVGANGSVVDNFSAGGIIISVDEKTGHLDEYGLLKPKYGLKSKSHPNTGIEFSSFEIPFYQQAKEMAAYFHSFLNLHSIGWDIAITEDGPVFIEGNDNWEINLPQTYKNPFKKEFKRLFYL